MINFKNVSITQLHNMYKNNEVSVSEVMSGVIETAKVNEFNAFIDVCSDDAMRIASEVDNSGVKSLFDGVPCVIKDNTNYTGYSNSCGSNILRGYKSIYNATVTNRLLANNCIISAKANMDEFAMGSSNTTSAFGNVLNPLDVSRIPGGSSGGSAAAVASGLVPFALGSDTGGSVRQPAAYCNIVGYRPTYGMISRHGVVSLNCSFDQIGIFANNVYDTALVFDMLQGKDEHDATTLDLKVNAIQNLDLDITKVKIAVVGSAFEKVTGPIKDNMKSVQEFLEQSGAEVSVVKMTHLKHADYAYLGIVASEVTSNLSMFDGIRYGHQSKNFSTLDDLYANTRGEGFGKEVKRRLLIGADLLKNANYDRYIEVLKLRRIISDEFYKIFESFDYILTPTAPSVAYTFEEYDNLENTLYESQFVEASVLAGLPGISIPMGIDSKTGMSHGLQILANRLEDAKVFALASFIESKYEVGEF